MTIQNTNLFSEGFNLVKNFLNANISDPKKRFKKQWIHASLPNVTDQAFDGYPFVTINVNISESDKSHNSNISNKTFRVLISVFSSEATEVDSISDEIISKFKDETLSSSLSEFKAKQLDSSPLDFQLINGRKIHRRIIGIIGVKRI